MARLAPELSLDRRLHGALDEISAPYIVLGGFAARGYGSTRTTQDIDIVVALGEAQTRRAGRGEQTSTGRNEHNSFLSKPEPLHGR